MTGSQGKDYACIQELDSSEAGEGHAVSYSGIKYQKQDQPQLNSPNQDSCNILLGLGTEISRSFDFL